MQGDAGLGVRLENDSDSSGSDNLENRIARRFSEKPSNHLEGELLYMTPKGEVLRESYSLKSIDDVMSFLIGPRDNVPFLISDGQKPFVYTFIEAVPGSKKNETRRRIVVSGKELPFESPVWDDYPEGIGINVQVPSLASTAVSYDDLKNLVPETDSSQIRMNFKKMQQELAETRKFKTLKKMAEDETVRKLEEEKARVEALTVEVEKLRACAMYAQLCDGPDCRILSQNMFREHKATHIRLAANNGLPAYIVFWDLHKFKIINDLYDKNTGDNAIVEFAKALRSYFKKDSDFLYRPGGDEFIAVVHKKSCDHGNCPQPRGKDEEWRCVQLEQLLTDVDLAISKVRIKNPLYEKDPSALDQGGRKIFEPDDQFLRLSAQVGYAEIEARDPVSLRGLKPEEYAAIFDDALLLAGERKEAMKEFTATRGADTHRHSQIYRLLHNAHLKSGTSRYHRPESDRYRKKD